MTDLFIASVIKLGSAVATWFLVRKRLPPMPRKAQGAVALLTPLAALLWMGIVRDSLLPARILPWGGVLILGNPIPECVAVLVVIARIHGTGRISKDLFTILLVAVGFFGTLGALMFPAKNHGDYRKDGVCLQTSAATCSAAAGATALLTMMIPATEGEMVRLCLTTRRGTSMLALYHGLAVKTRGTPLRVRIVPRQMGALRQASAKGPVILSVGVPRKGLQDMRYEEDWGWERGARHAVVLFRFTDDGRIEIGDPSVGREFWRVQGVEKLWHGPALALEPRETPTKSSAP